MATSVASAFGVYVVQRRIFPLRLAYAILKWHHNIAQLRLYLHIKFYLLSPNFDVKSDFFGFFLEIALGNGPKKSRMRIYLNTKT